MKKYSGIISFLIATIVHGSLLSITFIGKTPTVINKKNKKVITLTLNKLMITKKQVVETEYTNIKNYEVQTEQLGELNQDVSSEHVGKLDAKKTVDQQVSINDGYRYQEIKKSNDKLENNFDKEMDIGDKNSLKSKKFLYFGFYKKIKVQVDKEWNKHFIEKEFKDPTLEVLIQLSVDRYGNILKVVVDKQSNNKQFDAVALNVFKRIKRVEKPPKELMNNQKFVYILWAFSLKS